MDKAQLTTKWSEKAASWVETDVTNRSSSLVMRRSNMWPARWVGEHTCYFKLNESIRARKSCEDLSRLLSTWRLKSPVIRKLDESVTYCSRRLPNSTIKWSVVQSRFEDKQTENMLAEAAGPDKRAAKKMRPWHCTKNSIQGVLRWPFWGPIHHLPKATLPCWKNTW